MPPDTLVNIPGTDLEKDKRCGIINTLRATEMMRVAHKNGKHICSSLTAYIHFQAACWARANTTARDTTQQKDDEVNFTLLPLRTRTNRLTPVLAHRHGSEFVSNSQNTYTRRTSICIYTRSFGRRTPADILLCE
jgi:hypothetical protein